MPNDLKTRLKYLAAKAGAQSVGFAEATEVDADVANRYTRWLACGNNGTMGYLSNYPQVRRDPRMLLDDAQSARTIIACAFSYYHTEQQADSAARFAMYAHGSDYHEVLRKRLAPLAEALAAEGHRSRICVDSAPIMERYWAQRAGVGFQGRNGLVIVPGMGSYFFLAEIITTARIAPDAPCRLTCGDCGLCAKACPGGALRCEDGFDARHCLSYLSIEHRGELPVPLGKRVYGCDECQRVCPHNANPPITEIEEFRLRPALRDITREEILAMTQEQFSATFSHSAVKRVKLAELQRNARG